MPNCNHYFGLELLPERAVWSAKARTLWIADLHLGKAAAFRAAGQPAPSGTTEENLRRLDNVVRAQRAERLIVLGDFLHARTSLTAGVVDRLREWRRSHLWLDCVVVRGNHDRRAGDAPHECGFIGVDEPYCAAGVEGRHHPLALEFALDSGAPVLCGHIHPYARISGAGRDFERLPCFAITGRQIVLPAFGEFTGGSLVYPGPHVRLLVTTGSHIFCLSA